MPRATRCNCSSRSGAHVDIRVGMDVLAVISICPQVLNPCNNFDPMAIEVVVPGE